MKIIKFFCLLFLSNQFSFSLPSESNENNHFRNLQELSDDIIILHTNDVHCGIMEDIGYDGLMLYKKEMMKKYKNVITVDVGVIFKEGP